MYPLVKVNRFGGISFPCRAIDAVKQNNSQIALEQRLECRLQNLRLKVRSNDFVLRIEKSGEPKTLWTVSGLAWFLRELSHKLTAQAVRRAKGKRDGKFRTRWRREAAQTSLIFGLAF